MLSACNPGSNSNDSNPSISAAKSIKLSELKLDVVEGTLENSKDSFEYFPAGHFGDKTQYNGKLADEFGGAYAVHCRQGHPFSIEVKYPAKGIERDDAMKILKRLLPNDAGEIVEHDDEDLKKMDAKQAAEFFYFKGGPYSELLYADNSNSKVVQINLWTKKASG